LGKIVEDSGSLNEVNAYVLKAILDAGQERVVVASRDIFDDHGTKLLAQHKPLTSVLQQRLLERRLRAPLESSLRFESGLDKTQLRQALVSLLESDHGLAALVRPWAKAVEAQVTSLPLDPSLLFLLTTLQATAPKAFEHAVQGLALAGAMSARSGAGPGDLRLAMIAGLVHDIGELHLDPDLCGNSLGLDLRQFRQLVTHAHLGQMLLSGLKQYPLALSRAVGEHHERLDGSGYPSGRSGDALSPLGRMLAVVETTLGVLDAPDVPLARASFALRVVPGEYDGTWVDIVAGAARSASLRSRTGAAASNDRAWAGLAQADRQIVGATEAAQQLANDVSRPVRAVASRAAHLLHRLRTGWNEMGLWAGASDYSNSSGEVAMAEEELRYRLSVMKRDCLALQPDLSDSEALRMEPLWRCLAADPAR
jgi:hypothetical protein